MYANLHHDTYVYATKCMYYEKPESASEILQCMVLLCLVTEMHISYFDVLLKYLINLGYFSKSQ